MTYTRESILNMAKGAIENRVNEEMAKVVDNVLDPMTKASAKRVLTLKIEVIPDDFRESMAIDVSVSSKLAQRLPASTMLQFGHINDELALLELQPQIPGQMDMFGAEEENPKILKMG